MSNKNNKHTPVDSEIQMDFNLSSLSKEIYKDVVKRQQQDQQDFSMKTATSSVDAGADSIFRTPVIDTQYNRSDDSSKSEIQTSLTNLATVTEAQGQGGLPFSSIPVELQQIAGAENFRNEATVYLNGNCYHYMNDSWRQDVSAQQRTVPQTTPFTESNLSQHTEQYGYSSINVNPTVAESQVVNVANSSFNGFSLTSLLENSNNTPSQTVRPVVDYRREEYQNVGLQTIAYLPSETGYEQIHNVRQMNPADVQRSFVTQGQITDANVYNNVLSDSSIKNSSINQEVPAQLTQLSQDIHVPTGSIIKQGSQSYLRTESGWNALTDAQIQTAMSAPSSVITTDAIGLESICASREENILQDLKNVAQTTPAGSYAVYGNDAYRLDSSGSWKHVDRQEALLASQQSSSSVTFSTPEVALNESSHTYVSMSELMNDLKPKEFVPEGQIVDKNVYQSASQSAIPIDIQAREALQELPASLGVGTIVSQDSHSYIKFDAGWGELPRQQMQEALSAPSSIITPSASSAFLNEIRTARRDNVLTELQTLSADAHPGDYAVYGNETYRYHDDGSWRQVDYRDALTASQQDAKLLINATPSTLLHQCQMSALMDEMRNPEKNRSFVAQGKVTDDRIYNSVIRSSSPLDDVQKELLHDATSPLLEKGTIISQETPTGSQLFVRAEDGWKEIPKQQMQIALADPSSMISPHAIGLENVRQARETSILRDLSAFSDAEVGNFVVFGNEAYRMQEDKTWAKVNGSDAREVLNNGVAFALDDNNSWVKADRSETISELHMNQRNSDAIFNSFGAINDKKDINAIESKTVGTYTSGYVNALAYIPEKLNDGSISVSVCPTIDQMKPQILEKSFIHQAAVMDLAVLNSIKGSNKTIRQDTIELLSALPEQDVGTIYKNGKDTFIKAEDGWAVLNEADLKTVLSAPTTVLARNAVGIEDIQCLRIENIVSELKKTNSSLGTLAIYGNDAFQLQIDEKDGQKKWMPVDKGQAIQFASQNHSGVDVLLPESKSPMTLSTLNGFQKSTVNTELDLLFGTSVDGEVVLHHDRYFVKTEGNWIEISEKKASDILAAKNFKNSTDFTGFDSSGLEHRNEEDRRRVSKLLEQEDGFSAPLHGDTNAEDENDKLRIRYSTGRRDQVVASTRRLVGLGVNAVNTALMSDKTIAGEGYRRVFQTAEILKDTIGVATVELAKSILRKPLQREMQALLKRYGVQSAEELMKVLNQRLKNAGHKPLPMVKGIRLQIIASRQLGRTLIAGKLQNVATKEIADIYKTAHRIGVLTTFDSGGIRISERLTKGMRMFVSQAAKYGDIAGVGLANTYRLITTIHRSVKKTIRATRLTAKVARVIAKKTANAAAKLALIALRKSGGDVVLKKAADKLSKTGAGKKFSSIRTKIADKKKQKRRKQKQKLHKKREKLSKKARSKVQKKMNSVQTKIWNKLTNRFSFLRKFQQAAAIIAKLSALIAALISWLISLVFLLLAIVAGILVVVIVVVAIWGHFVTLFNFSNQQDSARAVAIKALSAAYNDDMDRIMELKSQGYESVNITYENVKNQDAYDENVGKKLSTGDGKTDDSTYKKGAIYTNESFQQTSNAAEILSMSCVKFDYDIGDGSDDEDDKKVSKRKLKKYVKGMYHGSHEIVVTENVTQDVDEDGKVVEHKTADVVYRSYFFDDVFDKTEADETPMTFIQAGFSDGTAEGVTTEAGMYAYLRDAGFSHNGACGIMGNAQQESSFNPRCQTGQYYGLFQWDSEAKNRLMTYCATNNLDYATIAGQVSFVAYDVGQGESSTGRAFKYTKIASILKDVTNSPEVCASVFCVGYERCVGGSDAYKYKSLYWPYSMSKTYSYQQLNKRIAYANAFANKYAQYQNDWSALKETISSGDTNSLIDYAKSWVGKIPYVYGGPGRGHTLEECASKQLGTDCSGFVASVFKHFGVSVPTSSSGYNDSKKAVNANAIQPGDIVVWPGSHVAIYIGNDQIVHAANERVGITISKLSSENKYHSQTPKYYRYYTPASSGTSGSGSYDLQTRAEYKNIQYGHNSIYNSGCGPTSAGNVIRNYVKPGSSTPTTVDMCNFAVKVGARESGGTNMYTLLSAAGSTYGFTYQYSSSYSALVNHLKAGKMAVIHTSGVEPFSSGGHFLAAIGMSGDKIIILDPFWTQSKKERYSKNGCTLTNVAGKVIVPKNVFTRGIDGYYLITKK